MQTSLVSRILSGISLALVTSSIAYAATAHSWNLSRSMMNGFNANSFGEGQVWTAMYDAGGETLNPANFQVMPTFLPSYKNSQQNAWAFPSSHSLIVMASTAPLPMGASPVVPRGMPMLYPGPGKSSVIRWNSPINVQVQALGRVSDANAGCGNGVNWAVLRDGSTVTAGTPANGANGDR